MRTYECKLSPTQIAEAHRMRFELAWAWTSIADHFGVDMKTIRRAIDPNFNRTSYGQGSGDEERSEHNRRKHGDLLFKLRALHVRKNGFSEARHLVLGVASEGSTAHPRFIPAVSAPLPMTSAIADA